MYSGKNLLRRFKFPGTCLLLTLILCACPPLVSARAQDHSAHEGHDGQSGHDAMSGDMPGMDMGSTAPDPMAAMRTPEKLAADKRESEFNHHLAGFFVVLAGIFILAEPWLSRRWPSVRYAWPVCFLLAGIFVLVYSDTELWPFGLQSWFYGLSHHMEVRQHKSFALILLAVGVIEFLRARGTLKAAWAGWVFPIVAIAGSIILLFHEHRGGMHGAGHMERMARIQTEHHTYTAAGFGIGLTKGLSEIKTNWQPVFNKLWPSIMIVLGVMLMFYVE
jgi:putative copper resistance protein D